MSRRLTEIERVGLERLIQQERERAYRRALKKIGCLPQTIDLMVERDREWMQAR